MIKKIFNFSKGFTILEAIVAISVVSLTIAGVFSVVRTTLNSSIHTKDEVKAFYLAREAVEIIRNKRDSNRISFLNGNNINWLSGIASQASDPCSPDNPLGNTCLVDSTGPGFTYLYNCGGSWNSCEYLRQDPVNYLYAYNSSWPQTKYRREIQVECVGACGSTKEIIITVSVKWARGTTNHEIKVKTLLLNWL